MVDETNQPKVMKLTNLLNAALGSPEPGCVNFNLLHNLLSSVLHHLKLEDVEASIEQVNTDEVRGIQLGTYMEHTVPALEDRLSKVESQLAILNSLPDNRQLLGDLYSGSEGKSVKQDTADNQRRVAELWQTVNINRRVDATEEGVSRLSSLIDDLLGQITQLKEDNKALQVALKQSQEDTTLKDRLNDLERKLADLEKQQNQDAQLLKNVVHMDALRGLVFWQSLGTAITGIDCMTAYAKATDARVSPHETTTWDTGSGRTERKLVEKLPEEYIRCPDPDLLSTLRKLGFVASGYDNVLERIDRLEELMALKLTRDDLEALGFSPALLKRIDDLEAISKELQKEREKIYVDCGTSPHMPFPSDNKKLIKNLQENLNTLREQIARIAGLTSDLQTETKEIRVDCKDLHQLIKDLDTRKADYDYVDAQMLKKADLSALADLLSRAEFEASNDEMHKTMMDLFGKLSNTDEELRELIRAIADRLDTKMDRDEIEQLRAWLEKRFKKIMARLRAGQSVSPVKTTTDEAAGLRRGLQHYHCISCDRPLHVSTGPESATPRVESRGFPSSRSIRPYTTYELDTIRQLHSLGANIYDVYGITRSCGGPQTTSTAYKRLNRGNQGRSAIYEDELGRPLPCLPPQTEVNLEGCDGQIYRGRITLRDIHSIGVETEEEPTQAEEDLEEVRLPPIPKTPLTGRGSSARRVDTDERRRAQTARSPQRVRVVGLSEHSGRHSVSPLRSSRKVQLVQPSTRMEDVMPDSPSAQPAVEIPTPSETKDVRRAGSSDSAPASTPTADMSPHQDTGHLDEFP